MLLVSDKGLSYFVDRASFRWLVWNACILFIYWAVLCYVYAHSVSPINATSTLLYLRNNPAKDMEGLLWAVALLPTITTDWRRPSDFGFTILYFIGLVPTLILFGLADQPRAVMYIILLSYIVAYFAFKLPIRIPEIYLKANPRCDIYIAAGITLFTFLWYLAKGDHSTLNINLLAVYAFRDQAGETFSYGPVAYLAAWTPRVLVPFCFCFFLRKKNFLLFILAFLFQMSCLIIYQEKSVFIPCAMLFLLYFAPIGRAGRAVFILALVATIACCELFYEWSENYILIQLWVTRFFFDQQFLYFNYFEVFRKIGVVYFSNSFLAGLIHYPFADTPAAMVAYYENGVTNGDPNTGFFGAGYMELGNAGVILSGFIAGLLLKIFDRVVPRGVPLWFFGTVAFIPFLAMLISENLFTSILTGGVGILLVLMASSGRGRWGQGEEAVK